jgi:glutamate-1-semialdehyde 2,1-aminomutase
MKTNKSILEKLEKYVAGGSSTGSKRARLMPEEPAAIARGRGCRVWDIDGREFIDYRNGLGPVTLGYCYPDIDEAVSRQLKKGIVFGHPGIMEAQTAEKLCSVIPCAEKIRFIKTGGEALAACIKIARAATGKERIIQIGYNGWLNVLSPGAMANPRDKADGVPKGVPAPLGALHHTVPWNDRKTVKKIYDAYPGEIAAVVVASDYAGMAKGVEFYPFLREITRNNESILIFDEIVTGFRISRAGAQEYFKVTPDMAVFAKGMANGMPLAAYCGSADLMDEVDRGTAISSTYGGEQLSLAAASAVLDVYEKHDVVGHLKKTGEKLWNRVNGLFREHGISLAYEGFPQCPAISGDAGLVDEFHRKAYEYGVSLYNVSYVNFSHKDKDISETVDKLEKALSHIRP